MLALPVGQTDQRLTPVADALHQQHDHSRNITDRRIAGHSEIPAENHGALIEQDQGDIGRIGQAKGRKAYSQNAGSEIAAVPVKPKRGGMLFEDKEYKADQKGHRLADCRGDGRPHHPPGQHPHEKVIQDDVRDKACHHGRHGGDRPAHVADERDQAGPRDLEYRPIADKA